MPEPSNLDRWSLHDREHQHEQKSLETALESEQRRLLAHREAHDAAHAAHEKLHEASDSTHDAQHKADEKALNLAVRNMEGRLDVLNELRGEVTQDRAQFVRVEVYRSDKEAMNTRIDTLERLIDRAEGAVNTWRFIAGFLGLSGIGAIVWALTQAPT